MKEPAEGVAAPLEPLAAFEPKNVQVYLFGCCDYEDTWRPGITGWGDGDADSRASGHVSVTDYDALWAVSKNLQEELANEIAMKNEWRELAERGQMAGTELVSLLRSSETRNAELEKEIAALRKAVG